MPCRSGRAQSAHPAPHLMTSLRCSVGRGPRGVGKTVMLPQDEGTGPMSK